MQNIRLRPVKPEDAKIIASWFQDKNDVRYMSTVVRARSHTEQSVRSEINNSDANYERLFMAELDGACIGHCGIDDIDFHDSRAEIFFIIGEKAARGKGLGKEIARQLLDIGFMELGLNSISASAASDNQASIRIIRGLGFSYVGTKRQFNKIGHRYVDELLFDMTAEEYRHNKERPSGNYNNEV